MKKRRFKLTVKYTINAVIACLCVSVWLQLWAADLTLDEATRQLQQQVGGQVLSAETVELKGIRFYKIKILLHPGKIKVFQIRP